MKPVDSHCHIDFDSFDKDRESVIERSGNHLEFMVNAGRNLQSNRVSLDLQQKHPDLIVANLGLHPTKTDSFDQLDDIKEQIREEDPVAIGEVGLDHHHVTRDKLREEQRTVFEEMLELAEELGKPVVVHSRNAEEEAIDIISRYSLPGVMLHCFNGSPNLAARATREGVKIGVTTQVLYSNAVQRIVEKIETGNMLLETDSPFLYRGDRNEPVKVIESAEKIAGIKQVEIEKVVSDTTSNARELFRN